LKSKSQAPVKKSYHTVQNLEQAKPSKRSLSDDKNAHDGDSDSSKDKAKVSKPKYRDYSYITNVDDWLKKNRLAPSTKVFIITCGYDCISEALKKRGWVKNPGYSSPCFHLKFTLKGSHIPFDSLQPY